MKSPGTRYIKRANDWLRDKAAVPYRRLFPRQKPDSWEVYRNAVNQGIGLEIGGPSRLWARGHFLPVYPLCKYVDGVNFATKTVWEGRIRSGPYRCEGAHGKGRQFIADAVDLATIDNALYDFVLASHVLEHIANPIKALHHWQRVIKTGGHVILAVPHLDGNLPLSRPVTSLQHLIKDWEDDTRENDLTHVNESVEANTALEDVGSREQNRVLLMRNVEHRMMHHHCFNPKLVVSLLHQVGLQIRAVNLLQPGSHIVCLAEKPTDGRLSDNSRFLMDGSAYLANDSHTTWT